MVLHVHKELTDTIDMVELANTFVGENQTREELFGKFSNNDLPKLFSLATKATQTETLGSQVGNTDETSSSSSSSSEAHLRFDKVKNRIFICSSKERYSI